MKNTASPMLPSALTWFLTTSIVFTMSSVCFGVYMVCTHGQRPFGLPSLFFNGWFSDLLTTDRIMWAVHRPEFFRPESGWIYPAPCIFVYEFFLRPGLLIHHGRLPAALLYSVVALTGVGIAGRLLIQRLAASGLQRKQARGFVLTSALCSWPLWMCVHQGNIELVLFLGLSLGAYCVFQQRWMSAAIVIGLVASLKLYPILLFGMFLPRRKYKELVAGLLVFVAANVLALHYFGPSVSVAWSRILPGLASFKQLGFYPGPIGRDYLCFDHSLVALIRVLSNDNPSLMTVLGKIWIPVCAVSGLLCFVIRVRFLPRLNQLIFFVSAMLLLPPKSFDYTSLSLYIVLAPAAVLAAWCWRYGQRIPGLNILISFVAVATSLPLIVGIGHTYYCGQFECLAILGIALIAIRLPLTREMA